MFNVPFDCRNPERKKCKVKPDADLYRGQSVNKTFESITARCVFVFACY